MRAGEFAFPTCRQDGRRFLDVLQEKAGEQDSWVRDNSIIIVAIIEMLATIPIIEL